LCCGQRSISELLFPSFVRDNNISNISSSEGSGRKYLWAVIQSISVLYPSQDKYLRWSFAVQPPLLLSCFMDICPMIRISNTVKTKHYGANHWDVQVLFAHIILILMLIDGLMYMCGCVHILVTIITCVWSLGHTLEISGSCWREQDESKEGDKQVVKTIMIKVDFKNHLW
jgi:hypothetical protein